jgi:hypothetical protein
VVAFRLNTRAFLSSHSILMTSIMKVLAALLSRGANLAVASGHHSPIVACSEGTMMGRPRRAAAPAQMAVA